MINYVVITGHYKGFNNSNLLLGTGKIGNQQIFKVTINEQLKDAISNNLKNDDIVGIKGYLELDKTQQIIIKATKITFLSN